jgi:hypothetical protein
MVVGRECLQMMGWEIDSSSRSTVSSIFPFLAILSYFHDVLSRVVLISVMVQVGGYD